MFFQTILFKSIESQTVIQPGTVAREHKRTFFFFFLNRDINSDCRKIASKNISEDFNITQNINIFKQKRTQTP